MKKLKLHLSIFLLLLVCIQVYAQQKRTVDFIGGARSFMTNNRINVRDSVPDTTTIKRNTGGYALIDLGVKIKPNSNTEILGMFRINNSYGGFWGSGVSFDVRQLWLKGIIGNTVRYQLGDLNLKQTPFTLYNHHADNIDSLPTIFNLQNQIISYEKFYTKNTWRQQGANVDFGLQFSKILKEINFTGYITRLQATNFTTIPDRLMGGGTVNIVQSKHLNFGYNNFSVFDVKGTVLDSNQYTNYVHTVDAGYTTNIKNNILEIRAEAGKSISEYSQDSTSRLKDYFVNAFAKFSIPKQHLEFVLGYLNVGPDFRSIGAQSKNINYNSVLNYYNRYSNAQIARPVGLMDVINNANLYTTSVSSSLLPANPIYNNVLPYGIATFNRIGAYLKVNYVSPSGVSIRAEHYNLSEIRGQGTFKLKKFMLTKLIAQIEINKLAHFERALKIQLGANMQSTNRTSNVEVEKVDLKNLQWNAGIEYEVFSKIDILLGYVAINTKGNDFIPDRNMSSKVVYFTNTKFNLMQQVAGAGARYRFSDKIYLCAMYQEAQFKDALKQSPNYNLKQFALIYNMTF